MDRTNSAIAIIEEFKQHLIADGKSLSTIESYVGDVAGFTAWLLERGQTFTGEMRRLYVTSYRRYLVEEGFEVATINKKVNSLQSFNSFIIASGYMTEQVIDLKKDKVKVAQGSEHEVEVLTERETEQLLFHVEDDKVCSSRDRLIVTLLLYTGVRVSELVNLRLRDLDCLGMVLKVAWGKGGKVREVPLRTEVVDAIQEYLEGERKQNKHCDSEYLLLTQRAGKMDRDSVNKVLKRIGKQLGIQINPHKFRHSFCSRLISRNVPITTVARLAGHAGIQTTATFYINTSRQDKREAVDLL